MLPALRNLNINDLFRFKASCSMPITDMYNNADNETIDITAYLESKMSSVFMEVNFQCLCTCWLDLSFHLK